MCCHVLRENQDISSKFHDPPQDHGFDPWFNDLNGHVDQRCNAFHASALKFGTTRPVNFPEKQRQHAPALPSYEFPCDCVALVEAHVTFIFPIHKAASMGSRVMPACSGVRDPLRELQIRQQVTGVVNRATEALLVGLGDMKHHAVS